MDTESLHTISAAALGLGLVFAALGGLGLFYSARSTQHMAQSVAVEALRVKLAALQKSNEELQERLRLADPESGTEPKTPVPGEPAAIKPATRAPARFSTAPAPSAATPAQPAPSPATNPPADWAGSSLLEEMIESSIATDPANQAALSEKQRAAITRILRKYADRSIVVHAVAGDDGRFQLAWALKAAFVEAGWHVEGIEQVPYASPPAGLFITSGTESSPEDAIIPHEALTTAGFQVSRCVDSNLKGDKTVLLVGAALK